jgi:hypothetical protein
VLYQFKIRGDMARRNRDCVDVGAFRGGDAPTDAHVSPSPEIPKGTSAKSESTSSQLGCIGIDCIFNLQLIFNNLLAKSFLRSFCECLLTMATTKSGEIMIGCTVKFIPMRRFTSYDYACDDKDRCGK